MQRFVGRQLNALLQRIEQRIEQRTADSADRSPATLTSSGVATSQVAPAATTPTAQIPTPHPFTTTATPRFVEPAVFLPRAERTFLRLIAVKPGLLFACWDIALSARSPDTTMCVLRVRADVAMEQVDSAAPPAPAWSTELSCSIDAAGHYIMLPDMAALRGQARAQLWCGGICLAVSNATILLPSRSGEVVARLFATIPIDVDRQALADGSWRTDASRSVTHSVRLQHAPMGPTRRAWHGRDQGSARSNSVHRQTVGQSVDGGRDVR